MNARPHMAPLRLIIFWGLRDEVGGRLEGLKGSVDRVPCSGRCESSP